MPQSYKKPQKSKDPAAYEAGIYWRNASRLPNNSEVTGSSPAAATKSGCFREKTATFFAFLLANDLGQRLGQVLTHR